MEKEIRTCFGLYLSYMRQHIKNLKEYDIDSMSVSDIDASLDVIYMQYIVTSSYSISKTSPGLIAFNHLKEIIKNGTVCYKCQSLKQENDYLKKELYDLKTKTTDVLMLSSSNDNLQQNMEIDPTKKGWFF